MLIIFNYKLIIIYFEEKNAGRNARKWRKKEEVKYDNLQLAYYQTIINNAKLTL